MWKFEEIHMFEVNEWFSENQYIINLQSVYVELVQVEFLIIELDFIYKKRHNL